MKDLHAHLEDKTNVLWDWNGTLLNDIDLCVDIINSILLDHGLPGTTRADYQAKFCFPIRKYYALIGFDYDQVPFEVVADEFIRRYDARVHECRLFEGAQELLASIAQGSRQQFILSAAREHGLKQLTKTHQIDIFLKGIYGLGDHYASSKVERGRQLLHENGLSPNDTILIGDTDHDLEVGQAIGIEVLLLGDGHQHPSRLESLNSRFVSSRYKSFG